MKNENPIIQKLLSHIEAECTAVDREAVFDEMIDECYSFDSVGGPFACMCPSSVLKEVDPVAYRCGVNDLFGTDDSYREIGNETYRNDEVEEARQSFIDDLESEISDLESEIEDLESEEDPNIQEVAAKRRELEERRADVKAVEDYAL